TSVMSSSCFAMSESRRSNGPSKFSRRSWNPGASVSTSAAVPAVRAMARLRDRAARDELSRHLAIGLGRRVRRCVLEDGDPGDLRIGQLDRALDDGLEDLVAEGLDDALEHLAVVQEPRVVHRRENAVEL